MSKRNFSRVLSVLLLAIVAVMIGQGRAYAASTFTVINSDNTFTVTRSGNTAVAEDVNYRTVSLSAIEGQHFTAASGTLSFAANDTSKTVIVTESTPGTDAYKFQSGTTRSYRFEVLDSDGYILASSDRTMTTGTQFADTYLNKSVTGLTYFDRGGDGSLLSGTTHYLDVAHSGSAGTWVKVGDGGYKQAVHTVSTAALYNNNSALRTYLNSIGVKMYTTVYFTQKEEDDGYQYIQILADNASTYDGDDSNGAVNTPSTSLYKACFILSYSPKGSVMSDPHTQFFPHRWNYADRAAQYSDNGWNWQEFDYDNAHLYEQEFKSATPSYCAENSGSLVLAPTVNNINIRFDAAGSDDDDWYFKDLKVRLALVDATAPTILNNFKVSGGRHQKSNVIYVSVPFSEIVTVTGTPTLATSWGTLSYTAGSGSNVLTFKGEISSDATGTLCVTALSGTVKDLAGNDFSGTVSKNLGTTLDDTYAWSLSDFNLLEANTYEIASKTDLRRLAYIVNTGKNPCSGLTFRQTQDITCDDTYIPIGYYVSNSDEAQFRGTYDGQGYTISGITVSRTGNTIADCYVGLFGYVGYRISTDFGTVKNVILASSTFTGYDIVGGIVGYNSGGTVQNCRVESTVTINAVTNGANSHGGIVGSNHGGNAKVIGCYSAATISKNGKSTTYYYGGIVGRNYGGTVKSCLYAGNTVTAANKKGAIIGYDEGNHGVFSNNYYTAINLGGVGADGSSSDKDGARRARTVSLGTGVALTGTQTAYSGSGLTAIGTTALQSGSTIYSGEGQTVNVAYSGTVPEGFMVTFSADAGTLSGTALTLGAADVTVSATVAPDYATHWHADADHDGTTAARAYIITTTTGLNLLATLVNGTVSGYAANDFSDTFFQLGGDIEYNATTAWDNTDASNTENNFTAIGGVSGNTYNYFKGTFDGDGHTISGIRITQKTKDSQGLFGRIGAGGTVKNLTLSNARIFSNKEGVGGIAGRSQGTITNCHVAADVNILGNGNYHGGIAGTSYGTITGCTSAVTLNWNGNYRGGITGQISSSATVSDCIVIGVSYSFGSNTFLGAIVGKIFDGTLTRNYYRDCSVNGATTNIGVGTETAGVSNDVDGARSVHTLNLGTDVTATGSETVDISGITYYAAGSTITLAYNGTPAAGMAFGGFIVTDANDDSVTVTGNTFTMPASDVTANAELITEWAWLNRQLAAGGTVTLQKNFTAAAGDTYLTVPANVTVTLDLNGYALDRHLTEAVENGYVIKVLGTLTVNDSYTFGGGEITGGYNTGNGGGVYVNGGTLTMEGGAITGNSANNGGGVYVNGGTLTMEGGAITGNSANTGGGVYQVSGTFAMSGGTISNNAASNNGGGVYMSNNATFVLTDGTISNNTAHSNGGGVYNAGTFTMNGGTVSNNTADLYGGGVYTADTFTMRGGTISNNTASFTGGGVYITYSTFNVSGSAVITGNTVDGSANNVYLRTGKVITVTDALTDTARIGVSMETPGVFTSGLSGNGTLANFTSDNSAYGVYPIGTEAAVGTLYAVHIAEGIEGGTVAANVSSAGAGQTVTLGIAPGNGCDLTSLTVTDADGGTVDMTGQTFIMPAGDVTVNATFAMTWASLSDALQNGGGSYKLPNDVTAEATDTYLTVPSGKIATLDLNGHTLSRNLSEAADDGFVIKVLGALTINDSSDPSTGTITGGYGSVFGGGIRVQGGALTLNGGAISGNISGEFAGGVYMYSGSFTMTGGTISGNTASSYGGGVYVEGGTFALSDGTISGNTASEYGGGVSMYGGTLVMTGGTITNNTANNGGGVYVGGGTTTLSGGTILNNTATFNGGGVYTDNSSTFTMESGAISSNEASNGGGVYVNSGTFTMTNGTISGNEATDGYGGGVYVQRDKTFIMSGGTISDNTATIGCGGGVYNAGTFEMNSGTISQNTTDSYGGGVFNAGTFEMNGGTITGNETPAYNGGGVYSSDTFEMTGGTISQNIACNGGGVYVGYGTFNMDDGSISGNTVAGNGGGVHVDSNGSFTMNDGAISDNTASERGGGVFVNGYATFTLTGGTITGNACGTEFYFSGGGVSMQPEGAFQISGSPTITGNTRGANGLANNVYLGGDRVITVTGKLDDTARIGVTMETSGVFTYHLSGRGSEENFTSDDPYYGVYLSFGYGGEAALGRLYSVTVDPGITNGTVRAPEKAAARAFVFLTITPDPGYELTSLTVTDEYGFTYDAGSGRFTMPESDVTITATFTWINPMELHDNADNTALIAAANGMTGLDVTIQGRTFKGGKKQTICLPFDPSHLLTLGTVWAFTGISEGKIVMTEQTGTLAANTPYIFQATNDASDVVFSNVTVVNSSDPKTENTEAGFTFRGTYTQKTWEADDAAVTSGHLYGFMMQDNDGQVEGQFVKARRKTILRPFSCYLEYNGDLSDTNPSSHAAARSATRGTAGETPDFIDIVWVSANGTVTGISRLDTRTGEITDSDDWYLMDGRKLNGEPTVKGLYINNGKVVIIK